MKSPILSSRACSFKKISCQQFHCAEPQMCKVITADKAPERSSRSQARSVQKPQRREQEARGLAAREASGRAPQPNKLELNSLKQRLAAL